MIIVSRIFEYSGYLIGVDFRKSDDERRGRVTIDGSDMFGHSRIGRLSDPGVVAGEIPTRQWAVVPFPRFVRHDDVGLETHIVFKSSKIIRTEMIPANYSSVPFVGLGTFARQVNVSVSRQELWSDRCYGTIDSQVKGWEHLGLGFSPS